MLLEKQLAQAAIVAARLSSETAVPHLVDDNRNSRQSGTQPSRVN